MPIADAIADIAEAATAGDTTAACTDLIAAIRDGRVAYRRQNREEIRPEALALGMLTPDGTLRWEDDYYTIIQADRGTSARRYLYSDLEVARSDVEALWGLGQQPGGDAVTVLSPGPKGGETKASQIAWQFAEQILEDDGKRPPRGHGRPTALARAVQLSLKERGHHRELNTITKDIRLGLREWEKKNPKK